MSVPSRSHRFVSDGNETCSFCGKSKEHVRHMICGPEPKSCICDACVATAVEIVEEALGPDWRLPPAAGMRR